MKKIITLATAGVFLLSLQAARAQREVQAPAIPPMLEGQRPLATPESSKEPVAPKKVEEEKAKPKSKGKAKTKAAAASKKKKAAAKTNGSKKKAPKVAKKKSAKAATKTKKSVAETAAPAGTTED